MASLSFVSLSIDPSRRYLYSLCLTRTRHKPLLFSLAYSYPSSLHTLVPKKRFVAQTTSPLGIRQYNFNPRTLSLPSISIIFPSCLSYIILPLRLSFMPLLTHLHSVILPSLPSFRSGMNIVPPYRTSLKQAFPYHFHISLRLRLLPSFVTHSPTTWNLESDSVLACSCSLTKGN